MFIEDKLGYCVIMFIELKLGYLLAFSGNIKQLLVNHLNDFKRLGAGDAVHKNVAVHIDAVLRGKY